MKAITVTGPGQVSLQEVPRPEAPSPGYVIVKMEVMGINPGDKFLISGNAPRGMFPASQYDIAGVSGVGEVVASGAGVPASYAGKRVTVYRSLVAGEIIVGTWSEYAHLPYLSCAILPEDVDAADYSGALVNIITPYAAWKQAIKEGHKGIIITAGNSATGLAMLGICQHAGFPVLSIVRNEEGKRALEALGAKDVLVQEAAGFAAALKSTAERLKTTAVFDGVGGAVVSDMMEVVPAGSTIYAYGFLGGPTPLSFHTSLLIKGITVKGFNNFQTDTVRDPVQLQAALEAIADMIAMPHFKTKPGPVFTFEQANAALSFVGANGAKALLKL